MIPNAEVCADKGVLGAKCAYTRNGPDSKYSKANWDKVRVGWFCLNAKDYGKYQNFVQDACAKNQNCVDEVDTFVKNLKQ